MFRHPIIQNFRELDRDPCIIEEMILVQGRNKLRPSSAIFLCVHNIHHPAQKPDVRYVITEDGHLFLDP